MTLDTPVLAALRAREDDIRRISDFLLAHPELSHEETETSRFLVGVLEDAGFRVDTGVAGLSTAFRAELATGRPGGTVGFAAVYDAAPAHRTDDGSTVATHSCGHSAQAAGVVGAALALADVREQLTGTVVVVGCPADEIHAPRTQLLGSGKALTAAGGVWTGVDAALYAHPEFLDAVWTRTLWMRRETAIVEGTRTLLDDADCAPLSAARRLLQALDALPRANVMLETLVIDGDVEEGSGLSLRAQVLLFSSTRDGLDDLHSPLRAALPEARWERGNEIDAIVPDPHVSDVVRDAFAAAGRPILDDTPPLPFATDFGAVTRVVPAALVGVGRPEGWAFHREGGQEQFAGPEGVQIARDIARVLALAGARLTA
ncbi:metal-dependent amidase/aminoacylase/carboxypeptidase family protein [Microbacterium sp. AG790]|uniref:M20/M25/M40 family metallo-hydrolase n=1 Tax=Microbacterium sp. AG790 TaxID=2183995 RepID=UPI000EAE925B|nr:M20/M25/M40 family metallo-hydrolase [Microbacterium sp. AG790]RKS93002.1 metal-dependent amidase/aminoacylase/carboxypeptidase family protein [Microbacterium sp. AG790]